MLVRRYALLGLVGALALSTLTGCGSVRRTDVVAAFYPLQFVAQQILGNHGSITDLTTAGQEPHDLQLTVQQTAQVAGAKVVFYEKGFQPAVDSSVAQDAQGRAVDAGQYVDLTTSSDPSEPGKDPHFWLDPNLLARVAVGFADAMASVDPANAATYHANADQLQRRLALLDASYRRTLKTCRNRTLVVGHDAFEYMARRYDLQVLPIAGLSPDAEPSARHLAQLRTLAQQKGVTTVFTETLASPKLADTLARELGVRTAVLDPLEGLKPGVHADYFSVMRANLAAIARADGCR